MGRKCIIILLSLVFLSRSGFCALEWKEEKGDHFIVYYQSHEGFAKDILRRSESYYGQIASDLGYARYSNFWQWENRVKIYVYPTKAEFQKATGQSDWSQGMADYLYKQITTYAWSEGFLDGLLPHEIAHLVFRDFVGFKGQVPLWLDEGVAQWEEPKKRAVARQMAAVMIQSREVFPLRDLTRISNLEGKPEKTVHFFYIQAVSVVDFLIRNYGSKSFADFCRQLRDGKNLDEALLFAYGSAIHDLDELQNKWIKDAMEAQTGGI